MSREARQVRCPEAVLGWIPWYSEGGLTEQQMGTVEAHASECAECRTEIDMVAGAPFEVDFDLPDPDRMFAEITQRIEERTEAEAGGSVIPIDRARVLSVDDLEAIESWVLDPHAETEHEAALSLDEQEGFATGLFPEFANGQTPQPMDVRSAALGQQSGDSSASPSAEHVGENVIEGPWARKALWAAAAALALFLMGGLGGSLLTGSLQGQSAPGSYSLASAPPDATVASLLAPQIDVVFLDSVSARDISNALRADGLEIVSGPSPLGVYRLALTQTAGAGLAPSSSDAAEIAARLSAPGSPIAMFAEPVP